MRLQHALASCKLQLLRLLPAGGPRRRGSGGPPRCACRAASIQTSQVGRRRCCCCAGLLQSWLLARFAGSRAAAQHDLAAPQLPGQLANTWPALSLRSAAAGDTYLRILRAAKAGAPHIHVHAFSPLEVHQGATSLGLPYGGRLPAAAVAAPCACVAAAGTALSARAPRCTEPAPPRRPWL
jgi:hypothetical protein